MTTSESPAYLEARADSAAFVCDIESPCDHKTGPSLPELSKPFCDPGAVRSSLARIILYFDSCTNPHGDLEPS